MKLSVVVPAHNEAGSLADTIDSLSSTLAAEGIDYELVVVDDGSEDDTQAVLAGLAQRYPGLRYVRSHNPRGFGFAVRAGFDLAQGDAVAVVMADGSDDPADLVRYHRLLEDGYDCAFGSRFLPGSVVEDYPKPKLVLNRIVNWGIRMLFRHGYNDTTNAFKAYRREVIDTVQPLLSNHFNLTVELPLKAVIRGHSYAVIPISWRNRKVGSSKLSLQEMGSRYLFIVLYAFLEHHLSRGDYRLPDLEGTDGRTQFPEAGTPPPLRSRSGTGGGDQSR
ncbi:MAG TPA: glycosyltransferase family 2 protein [Gaiellaceae bacterium]|nr:glycosyltransferase family 2 protein [Gaiellaceae bacterium]